jgi:hypothetical protein
MHRFKKMKLVSMLVVLVMTFGLIPFAAPQVASADFSSTVNGIMNQITAANYWLNEDTAGQSAVTNAYTLLQGMTVNQAEALLWPSSGTTNLSLANLAYGNGSNEFVDQTTAEQDIATLVIDLETEKYGQDSNLLANLTSLYGNDKDTVAKLLHGVDLEEVVNFESIAEGQGLQQALTGNDWRSVTQSNVASTVLAAMNNAGQDGGSTVASALSGINWSVSDLANAEAQIDQAADPGLLGETALIRAFVRSESTAGASITPSTGGTVSLGNNISISIPGGALGGTSATTVTIQQTSNAPAASSGFTLLGNAYDFTIGGQEHYTFNSPVTLTFPFNPASVPSGDTPVICYYDSASSLWVSLGGIVSGDTITVTVSHFTMYAVMTTPSTGGGSPGGGGGGGVTVQSSSISPTVATFDENPSSTNHAAVPVTVTWNGQTLTDIKNGGATLTQADYTVSGSIVTILESYLATLTASTTPVDLIFDFSAGSPATLAVTVVDTFNPLPVPPPTPASIFSDVPASFWGYNAISRLSSEGIVAGYPDGTFKPNAAITRAEFTTMLVKALGLNAGGTTGQFTDVTADAWYYGSVNAAVYAGLVSGMGDNLFAPEALITREQMAVMVAKALGNKAPATDGTELNAFSDRTHVSSWAVTGMEEVIKAGIVVGMSADSLVPLAHATRAQAAAMLYNALAFLGK